MQVVLIEKTHTGTISLTSFLEETILLLGKISKAKYMVLLRDVKK